MSVADVDYKMLFVSEYFVTDSARRLNCAVEGRVLTTQSALGHKLFATNVATNHQSF